MKTSYLLMIIKHKSFPILIASPLQVQPADPAEVE